MPTAAIIGGGVIGSAWASRFLLTGGGVRFHAPAPNSEAVLNRVLDKARRWVPEVYDQLPPEGALSKYTHEKNQLILDRLLERHHKFPV